MNRRSLLRATLGAIAMIPLGRKKAEPEVVMLRGGATAYRQVAGRLGDFEPEYDYFSKAESNYSSTLLNQDIGTHTHLVNS